MKKLFLRWRWTGFCLLVSFVTGMGVYLKDIPYAPGTILVLLYVCVSIFEIREAMRKSDVS